MVGIALLQFCLEESLCLSHCPFLLLYLPIHCDNEQEWLFMKTHCRVYGEGGEGKGGTVLCTNIAFMLLSAIMCIT